MRNQRRRCSATSKQTGNQCRRYPVPGAAVCCMHGGKAPQVQRTARQRIASLVDPAIDTLAELLKSQVQPRVALGAAKDVLDRAGVGREPQPPMTLSEADADHQLEQLIIAVLSAGGNVEQLGLPPMPPQMRAELDEMRRRDAEKEGD